MKPPVEPPRLALAAGLVVLLEVLPLLSLEVPVVALDGLLEVVPDMPPGVLPDDVLPDGVLPLALAAGLAVLLDVLPLLSLELPPAVLPDGLPGVLPDRLPAGVPPVAPVLVELLPVALVAGLAVLLDVLPLLSLELPPVVAAEGLADVLPALLPDCAITLAARVDTVNKTVTFAILLSVLIPPGTWRKLLFMVNP